MKHPIVFITSVLLVCVTISGTNVDIETVHKRRHPVLPSPEQSPMCNIPCGKMTGVPLRSTLGVCSKPGETCLKNTYNKYVCGPCPKGWSCMNSCRMPSWYEIVTHSIRDLFVVEVDSTLSNGFLRSI